eukprot:12216188-Alexandrium_andersonii.AAC.3
MEGDPTLAREIRDLGRVVAYGPARRRSLHAPFALEGDTEPPLGSKSHSGESREQDRLHRALAAPLRVDRQLQEAAAQEAIVDQVQAAVLAAAEPSARTPRGCRPNSSRPRKTVWKNVARDLRGFSFPLGGSAGRRPRR